MCDGAWQCLAKYYPCTPNKDNFLQNEMVVRLDKDCAKEELGMRIEESVCKIAESHGGAVFPRPVGGGMQEATKRNENILSLAQNWRNPLAQFREKRAFAHPLAK